MKFLGKFGATVYTWTNEDSRSETFISKPIYFKFYFFNEPVVLLNYWSGMELA